MSDLLAIVDSVDADDDLVAEIARRHGTRVTVLVETTALSDRVASLLAAIEARTGAVVVGLAESREQLRGWRFDRTVRGRRPTPAL